MVLPISEKEVEVRRSRLLLPGCPPPQLQDRGRYQEEVEAEEEMFVEQEVVVESAEVWTIPKTEGLWTSVAVLRGSLIPASLPRFFFYSRLSACVLS